MNSATVEDRTPWYRQRWPWLVMLPPAVAVVGCIITITLAVRSADGIVAADYYKRGLAINEQLARSERAAQLGLRAEVSVRGINTGDEIRVSLQADKPLPRDATLKLRLVHPGRDGADREALLAPLASHAEARRIVYAGNWQEAQPVTAQVGWRLVLETSDWRIDGDASMIGVRTPLLVGAGN